MQWHRRKGQRVWSKESKATLDIGVTLRMNQKVAETPFTKPCLLNKWNNRVRKTHEQHRVAFRNPRTTAFRTKGNLWFTYSGNATDHWGSVLVIAPLGASSCETSTECASSNQDGCMATTWQMHSDKTTIMCVVCHWLKYHHVVCGYILIDSMKSSL